MPYKKITPIIDYKMRALCVAPYHNHKKGCPNFNKKAGCPPNAGFFDKMYDLSKPVYIIWNEFDLGTHVSKLKSKFPNRTEHQLKCCLYWQPRARQKLLEEIELFLEENLQYTIERCPEATGINLTDTMRQIGIELEWPPQTKTYQIAIAAIKTKQNE